MSVTVIFYNQEMPLSVQTQSVYDNVQINGNKEEQEGRIRLFSENI